jgi:hypothetical protein
VIVPGHDRHFSIGPDNSVQYIGQSRTEIRSYADPEREETIHRIGKD